MTAATKKLCGGLGVVLILGGIAHSFGVTHLYVTKGLPDLNRILLDIWIAEAQIVGGVLFVAGAQKTNPLPWIVGGALCLVAVRWAGRFVMEAS